ncbi:carbon-nitrogen hydrolase [Aspergillus steynii IBT 23096]|uniref:Carbon-nitrogen hydrolase n=1 Tax=Aspergillus steynii IBT 23096 TaxID=1392250 RepID=A0A2I2GLD2_9EURO|nr:carbon-nitrogen hydrolase [Aspergillus steynii IBT 23096]PLB53684.1 carbon-nitrogen hydrolase [Aspergillus steynii IBT 23096]
MNPTSIIPTATSPNCFTRTPSVNTHPAKTASIHFPHKFTSIFFGLIPERFLSTIPIRPLPIRRGTYTFDRQRREMKIATLQFAPKLGDVEGNIRRANELLQHGKLLGSRGPEAGIEILRPDILVLPELALTGEFNSPVLLLCFPRGVSYADCLLGYNFPSLEAIRPYLEPTGQGASANWARDVAKRYRCKVCVGYPEIETRPGSQDGVNDEQETCYNSLLVVDETGEVLVNYRKTFLYYTDETWAEEGTAERSFKELSFAGSDQGAAAVSRKVATSFGICMDINPYQFKAPFTAWEFANRVLDSKTQLVVLSMAWLTLLSREELEDLADKPDLDTFNYWIQRFIPLLRQRMSHESDVDDAGAVESDKRIILVFANRAGEEEGAEGANLARYAGTSAIIAVKQRAQPLSSEEKASTGAEKAPNGPDEDGAKQETPPMDVKIHCWNLMGAATEGICFADTQEDPRMIFELVKRSG